MASWNRTQLAKRKSASQLAHNRALMDVLDIQPGPHQPGCLLGQELNEHVQSIYQTYVTEHEFDKPENSSKRADFQQAVRLQEMHRGSFLIYHPQHVLRWQEKIEDTPVHKMGFLIEREIFLFTYEMQNHYGVEEFTTQDVQYLKGIIQERIHERITEGIATESRVLERLQAAVKELEELLLTNQADRVVPSASPTADSATKSHIISSSPSPTAPLVIDRELAWQGLFINRFTVSHLDRLLVSVGLLVDSTARHLTEEATGSVWVGVFEALRVRKKLRFGNNAALFRALKATYPDVSVKIRTIQTAYDPHKTRASYYHNRVIAFLSNK